MTPGRPSSSTSSLAAAPPAPRLARGPARRRGARPIRCGVLDLSGPYRKTFDDTLPDATPGRRPVPPREAGQPKLDECRRRVQNETLGHRGRKDDPLYRARRLLTKADERLDDRGEHQAARPARRRRPSRRGAHWPGTPRKSSARSTTIADPDLAAEFVDRARPSTSKTTRARPRSARSAAPSSAGETRSSPGTTPT